MSRPIDSELRERLLTAAAAEFAARGFAGATMAAIGRRAGVTKGGVYFHFRGKEELFFAVFDARRSALRALLAGPAADAGSGATVLRRFVRDYLDFHFEDEDASRLLSVLVSELRDRFTAELREDAALEQRLLRARIRELLGRGNHDGSLFCPDPALAAFVLAGALRGVLDQWLHAPAEAEPFCDAARLAEEIVTRYATGALPTGEQAIADDAGADFRPPF